MMDGSAMTAASRRSSGGRASEARRALSEHWVEYAIEGTCLGLFMISACLFVTLIEHPASWLRQAIGDAALRRCLIGVAMGATAITIIYSPWGKRSGAHINPAATFTFWRLGKIEPWDALFYIVAQFIGAVLGMALARGVLGMSLLGHPSVDYVQTHPGTAGVAVAFFAETAISFGLMLMVLVVSNRREWNRYTGLFVGAMVTIYIAIEAPLSGTSMNPARSFGSALAGQDWHALWLYFTAPPLGMLLAAQLYVKRAGLTRVLCCKLHHDNDQPCIFRCAYHTE